MVNEITYVLFRLVGIRRIPWSYIGHLHCFKVIPGSIDFRTKEKEIDYHSFADQELNAQLHAGTNAVIIVGEIHPYIFTIQQGITEPSLLW